MLLFAIRGQWLCRKPDGDARVIEPGELLIVRVGDAVAVDLPQQWIDARSSSADNRLFVGHLTPARGDELLASSLAVARQQQ